MSEESVYKVLTSSGTTGQQVSRVYLDTATARLQSAALARIMTHVLGPARLPMLIIDSRSVLSNRSSYSARGAGILGLSIFGKDHTYVLDEDFNLDEKALNDFLERHRGRKVLIFGFTFMIWQYLHHARPSGSIDLGDSVLIHSGGWKKLNDLAVDNTTFRTELQSRFNLRSIYNFYGMVEQVGSVFMENSAGSLQCPNFADVIIRDPEDFSILPRGRPGLVQVVSALPMSYPGHSLLTEDIGVLEGEDDSPEGWMGKHFRILGRAKKAELRGCSDTFKNNHQAA